jgi:2-C-methyl-D-erythritol 4-phosphate cytidylyltransferase
MTPHSESPVPSCTAVIVAAGSSSRMGFDKLAAPLGGRPVLRRTFEAFLAADSIHSIVVACPPDLWNLLEHGDFTKPVVRVDGGATRQASVAAGIAAAGGLLIAVHDGARPLVSPEDIDRTVAAAAVCGAAALARRVTETLKRSDANDRCLAAVDRENLWFMETPQVFRRELLEQAFRAVAESGAEVTDEVSAMELIGVATRFIPSLRPNLKITTPADLALAEALREARS